MKKKISFLSLALLFTLTACSEDNSSTEELIETAKSYEPSTEELEEMYQGFENDQEDAQFDMNEIESNYPVGMDYNTYNEELLGVLTFASSELEESTGNLLDVVIAKDGFIGILNSPDDGIIEHIRFSDMYEADAYFNN